MTINFIPMTYMPPAIDNNVDGFLANAESLTPESLLLYCQTQLGALDGDIKGYMEQQKTSMAKKKVLQELKTELQTNNPTSSAANGGTADAIAKAYADTHAKLSDPKNPAYDLGLAAAVQAEFAALFPGGDIQTGTAGHGSGKGVDGDNNLPSETADSWQGRIDTVAGFIDDIRGNSEIAMIQLQSIMSQRQTAIQLTTTILDKYSKGLDQIVANFK